MQGGIHRQVSFPVKGHATVDLRKRYVKTTTVSFDFGVLRSEETTEQFDLTDEEVAAIEAGETTGRRCSSHSRRGGAMTFRVDNPKATCNGLTDLARVLSRASRLRVVPARHDSQPIADLLDAVCRSNERLRNLAEVVAAYLPRSLEDEETAMTDFDIGGLCLRSWRAIQRTEPC